MFNPKEGAKYMENITEHIPISYIVTSLWLDRVWMGGGYVSGAAPATPAAPAPQLGARPVTLQPNRNQRKTTMTLGSVMVNDGFDGE